MLTEFSTGHCFDVSKIHGLGPIFDWAGQKVFYVHGVGIMVPVHCAEDKVGELYREFFLKIKTGKVKPL